MPEIRKEQIQQTVDYLCPECKTGRLRPTGMILTSNPAQYPHKCTKCEHFDTFLKVYPYIEYINKK